MKIFKLFKIRYLLYFFVFALLILFFKFNVRFTDFEMTSDPQKHISNNEFQYNMPLDPASPWPKFRNNALQNGRSTVIPEITSSKPWVYETGKGIFSSPVVDNDGNVYIGSADHYFYAIDKNGKIKWKHLTGEIIDSSALLDDKGNVFVGSGDGYVYAFEKKTGKLNWKFKAHTPEEVKKEFGINTHNVNWFEGNIGMLPDGTLLAPNDNYLVYALDRETGKISNTFPANEMIWSLPAVNSQTGRIFFGTCFTALKNVFCYNYETGEKIWNKGGLGTNAATIMLTSENENGAALVGGFDGMLRAYSQKDGFHIWKFGARDHIYASPGSLSDGTVIQPSADGTVYALDPENGKVKWAFDTREPIRSSPAIDGNDCIYVGSGEGRLFCINSDGTLRWAYQCITDDRNDLNASPALGREGVYVAGESGGIFYIPYDYPLSETGKKDPLCAQGPDEDLPEDGSSLYFTTRFGGLLLTPPEEIDANEPLTFSLFVREKNDTILSAIDKNSLKINFADNKTAVVKVSADKKFITIVPREKWTGPEGGTLNFSVSGNYITGMKRFGLKFFGGNKNNAYSQSFSFKVNEYGSDKSPYFIPRKPGDKSSAFELSRLAAPNPSMLPSWNQIGFDSLHYIFGIIEGEGSDAVVWGIGGKPGNEDKKTVVDPSLKVRFPLNMNYEGGLFTLYNYEGFLLDFNGTWDMPYASYRLASIVDAQSGMFLRRASLNATANCDDIEFYGPFLKLTGMSEFDTGQMHIYGGCNFNIYGKGYSEKPTGTGNVTFLADENTVSAAIAEGTLKTNEHVFSILLVNVETGKPAALDYAGKTEVQNDSSGNTVSVKITFDKKNLKGSYRVYYIVDTYPAAKGSVEIK